MAEHVQVIQELKQLPDGAHIFCPRLSDNRTDDSDDPGQEDDRVLEARQRRDKFFSALPLLAYDGPECYEYHQWLYNAMDTQLAKCEACIRQYYLGKIAFKEQLLQEYDDAEVQQFLSIIHRRDLSRIKTGLDDATATLQPLPKEERGPKALNNRQLFAFFETLHCDAFYDNDELLKAHFDRPFNLVQTHRDLRIKDILPAVTKFLFSPHQHRLNWAIKTYQRLGRHPSDEEWDWAIKNLIKQELDAIKDDIGLIRFWGATKLICGTLSDEQITIKLFDLGFNFARLFLDHLAKPTVAISYIIGTLHVVWTRTPDVYWQNLPSVSAGTVAEQIFASPKFNEGLDIGAKDGNADLLSWIAPFLNSLPPANRPPATRTLTHQLFIRVKSTSTSDQARQLCFEWAVRALVTTIIPFSEDDKIRKATARPVLSDVLTLVSTHLPNILSFQYTRPDNKKDKLRDLIVTLVRNTLALDCLMLKTDWEGIHAGNPVTNSSSHTPDLWRTVNRHLDPDRSDLSQALLISTMSLTGLEQFPARNMTSHKIEKESFNTMFGKVEDLLSQCIDHLAEFPAEHLDPLFSHQNTNMALMALLFSGNDSIYQATLELIKNISNQSGRIEALHHVTKAFFANTLYSTCWVFRRIANLMPFSPIPRLLKTGKDLMDILCDNTGLLREQSLVERDGNAVQAFWQYCWGILTTIFRRMEKWSVDVGDRPLMTEVCRNTMQFAQALFGHYYLFVNVLERNKEPDVDVSTLLLNVDVESTVASPPKALDSMVKWLRLRDPYLAETLVNLIIGMLRRLKEYGTQIPQDGYALTFVEEVAAGSNVKGRGTKTILNDNQKAELVRALEQYTGKQIAIRTKAQLKKQQRLDSWTDPNLKQEVKPKPEVISIDDDDDDDIKDEDLLELEKVQAIRKQGLPMEKKEQKPQQQKRPSIPSRPAPPSLQEQLAKKQAESSRTFIEQRKKAEAEAKARQKELAARRKAGATQTSNAGSGLRGLGVPGKDHTTPRSDLMVSSESEDEDSEEDELFGTSSKTATATATNGIRRPDRAVPMPTKKVKQVRSAKDMRARLSPDLTGLHKTILAWDFFVETDTPPNSTKDDYTLVTNTFRTVEDYQKTFEPLLVLEGWQSFRTAREDGSFKVFEVKVANSMIVDNFFEVNSTISMNEGKELNLAPADVVLLSKGSRPHVEPNEPHCLARIKEITRKRGEMQIVYRVNSSNNKLRNYLNDKATVFAVNVLSLTPLEREYGALMALPYYDLSEEIIRAKPSPLLAYRDEQVEGIRDLHNLNVAQAKAVKSAVDNDAFTLIQGPPGSGKTKTITAILSAMLTGMASTNGPNTYRPLGSGGPPPSTKKILVAAPSNAAVDELVMRFKDGIKVPGGHVQKINVVRLGRSEAINTAVKDVTLEELVNARLSENVGTNGNREDIHTVMMEHKKASDDMVELRQKMDATRQKGEQVSPADDQLQDGLRRKKTALSAKIDQMREQQNSANRDADINRRRIQQEILDSAHVLCATLSGSGHEIFQGLNVEFDTVIIDEAAQSIELSALIPLKYGCSKCILVGDPKQLPPTVLSRQAAKYQYEQSLFARMANNHGKDVHLLDVQYRMHPEISAFPSKTFYDSRLRDGPDMAQLRTRPWHRSQYFSPYRFFDVEGMSSSAPKGRSLVNEAEIEAAMAMYDRLTTDVPRYNFKRKIGIITPYKGQLKSLKQRFSMRYGEAILGAIDFNTTDAFQGRESEIIIFSCVRASTQGIGFLKDVRRMNVGLTRAKCSLWVLGNSQALVQGEFWKALVEDAKARNLYTKDNILRLLSRPLLTEDMMKDDVEMENMDDQPTNAFGNQISDFTSNPNTSGASSRYGTATPTFDSAPSRQASAVPSLESGRSSPREVSIAQTNGAKQAKQLDTGPASARGTLGPSKPDSLPRQSSGHSASSLRDAIPRSSVQPLKANDRPFTPKDQTSGTGTNGPSGGRFGLNANINCTTCGSNAHFSHNCDNRRAREASLGKCMRCGGVGHTKPSCTASRCLACGDFGHVESACTSDASQRLGREMRQDVSRQEDEHQRLLQRRREQRAQKQLGEHGASIPTVKTDGVLVDHSKRKRDSEHDRNAAKAPRLEKEVPQPTAGDPATRRTSEPKMARPDLGPNGAPIIRKKRGESAMFAKKR
ncbi:DEAD-box type RNA helicase [Lithohypha guttulata]|uniref:DEAD-box type RNA helicase n=1 Tax=Lithohypha guttulata TaxID=1690604 RepID=A0AAN7YEW9_9EURO|nr:DEAD-box type RNA helicase [Lithohypha guttulata]